MLVRHVVCFFLILILNFAAHARSTDSLSLEGSIALPSVTILNPDSSKAGYDGLTLLGRLHFPTYVNGKLILNVHGAYKRMNIENTYSGYGANEVAVHSGPGLGFNVLLGKIVFGFDYMLMNAEHYYVGGIGLKSTYDYQATNIYAGINFNFGDLKVGVGYSLSQSKISASETGLSKASDYSEQSIYLQFIYNTDANINNFAKDVLR